jgi:hypothetical protein
MKSPKTFPAKQVKTDGIKDPVAKTAIEKLVKEMEFSYRWLRSDITEINLGKDGALYFGRRSEQGVWEENSMRIVRITDQTRVERMESGEWVLKWGM